MSIKDRAKQCFRNKCTSQGDSCTCSAQRRIRLFFLLKICNYHLINKFCCFQNQYEGNQWGRPGPGGPYWRERTLTGQGFFEKMVNMY